MPERAYSFHSRRADEPTQTRQTSYSSPTREAGDTELELGRFTKPTPSPLSNRYSQASSWYTMDPADIGELYLKDGRHLMANGEVVSRY